MNKIVQTIRKSCQHFIRVFGGNLSSPPSGYSIISQYYIITVEMIFFKARRAKGHSTQFQDLCSTKSSSETLQNLPQVFCIYENPKLLAFIRGKYRVAQNEKRKKQLWVFVYIYKIWKILKHFAGTFRRAQTLKLGGVHL